MKINYVLRAMAIASLSSLGVAKADISSGLVLHYSFDTEPVAGVVADESGSGNDGVANGTTFEPSGRIGGALAFNGAGDSVAVNNLYIIEPWNIPQYSVSLWFLSESEDNFTGSGHLISDNRRYQIAAGLSGSDKILYSYAGSYLDCCGGDPAVTDPLCIAADTWHHVVLVVDEFADPSAQIFVDGQLVGASTGSGANFGGYGLLIGALFDGFSAPGNFWNGLIDDVRVYNRTLTIDEIAELGHPAGDGDGDGPGLDETTVLSIQFSDAVDGAGNQIVFANSDTLYIRVTDAGLSAGSVKKMEAKVKNEKPGPGQKEVKVDFIGEDGGSFLAAVPLSSLKKGVAKVTIEGNTLDKEKRKFETYITIE
jgi:Concanavalin A-like lectin/glucanases superfamily